MSCNSRRRRCRCLCRRRCRRLCRRRCRRLCRRLHHDGREKTLRQNSTRLNPMQTKVLLRIAAVSNFFQKKLFGIFANEKLFDKLM